MRSRAHGYGTCKRRGPGSLAAVCVFSPALNGRSFVGASAPDKVTYYPLLVRALWQ